MPRGRSVTLQGRNRGADGHELGDGGVKDHVLWTPGCAPPFPGRSTSLPTMSELVVVALGSDTIAREVVPPVLLDWCVAQTQVAP